MKFHEWLTTAWTNLLSWFGVKEQKIASFLYPLFQDAKQLVEKDLWTDIIGGVPVVAAALVGVADPAAALSAGLAAAGGYLLPLLEKQSVTLAQTTINTLSNSLVAQAQASLASTAAATIETNPAPAIVVGTDVAADGPSGVQA